MNQDACHLALLVAFACRLHATCVCIPLTCRVALTLSKTRRLRLSPVSWPSQAEGEFCALRQAVMQHMLLQAGQQPRPPTALGAIAVLLCMLDHHHSIQTRMCQPRFMWRPAVSWRRGERARELHVLLVAYVQFAGFTLAAPRPRSCY